jgi:multidrug resistance efflux pump
MQPNPKIIIPVASVLLVGAGILTFLNLQQAADTRMMVVSGTIEATQIDLSTQIGGEVKQVYVNQGDVVRKDDPLIAIYNTGRGGVGSAAEKIVSPINGVVLERLFEVGENVPAGTTVVSVADLHTLKLTIYVPEDRYGAIQMGQVYPVMVDSFPGETFRGTVTHIADQAEYTPRNVQTVENRKTTVFAIELTLTQTDNRLKPGMPADVRLEPVG